MADKKSSPVEKIKAESKALRGTLHESLADPLTGAIREPDQALIKFHGIYQQDDRDRREERSHKKLEWLYSFMIRLRLPGGLMTPDQWLGLHHIAGEHSTGVIKITTRQTIQLHGVLKSHLRPTVREFNTLHLDSIAACGDVNRNVICSSHPSVSPAHEAVFKYADKISLLALPKTKAYYQIWIDGKPADDAPPEEEPLYGETYLPRKFKIAIAIPPNNDVDVFANDIGLIAIIENDELIGFNLAVGGGLGTTHGNAQTYPRLATLIGFLEDEDKILKVVYEIIAIQRDFGNRSDRKLARLKYTIDRMGIDNFKKELEKRCGFGLEEVRPYTFSERQDYFGWKAGENGKWHYTLFIENGRVADEGDTRIKSALYKIAETGKANFRFTANQNLILSDVSVSDKNEVDQLLHEYGMIAHTDQASPIRKNAIACVAFNTCPLALAEGQRYLPSLITKIETLLENFNLSGEAISIRMTGCPNGCGRPYLSEIGLIGTAYGKYNLHLGGDRLGRRLNIRFRENLDEEGILSELNHLFNLYSGDRINGETLGDFVIRKKLVVHES